MSYSSSGVLAIHQAHDDTSKIHGLLDERNAHVVAAHTSDRDAAVPQNAPDDPLVDVDRFEFLERKIDGDSANEPRLSDHLLVCHS